MSTETNPIDIAFESATSPEPMRETKSRRPATRRRPVQDRSKETVASILEAAAQVLVRDGHAKTTTIAVAERAGISVGTLYHYFPNKTAILDALLQQVVRDATTRFLTLRQQVIEEVATRGGPSSRSDTEHRARVLFSSAIELIREYAPLSRALFASLPAASCAKIVIGFEDRLFNAIPSATDPVLERLREHEPKRYEATVSLWITMVFAAIVRVGLDTSGGLEDEMVVAVLMRAFMALLDD